MSHRDNNKEVGPNATIIAVLASINRRHKAILILLLLLLSKAINRLQQVAAVLL